LDNRVRPVAAASIHDEDFVKAESRNLRERGRQGLFLVQGGDDDGDLHAR
jgi:hypothetical protein